MWWRTLLIPAFEAETCGYVGLTVHWEMQPNEKPWLKGGDEEGSRMTPEIVPWPLHIHEHVYILIHIACAHSSTKGIIKGQ